MTPLSEKTAALLASAKAYLDRGEAIQYDQLSMDRVVRITPRHDRFAPPESATAQHTVYLDCASFVNAVYFTAFGRELAADVTWNMMELVKPRIFDYRPTHQETPAQRRALRQEVLSLLRPGDAIVMRYDDNGHIILCGEEGWYYHCNEKGGEKSYRYDEKHDSFTPGGAVYRDALAELFDEDSPQDLLAEKVVRFSLLRPLDGMDEPTPAAYARLTTAAGLRCSVLSSHSGGQTARRGETITYTVRVENLTSEDREVTVTASPTDGGELPGKPAAKLPIPAGGTVTVNFPLKATAAAGAYMTPPAFTVNGLPLWAERVLLHGDLPEEALQEAASAAETAVIAGAAPVWPALRRAYGPVWAMAADEASFLASLFTRYDSLKGDVLWRRTQQPWRDGCLYGYFGGVGVVTPEAGWDTRIRTKRITAADLRRGDVIVCSDDALYTAVYACLVTETGLAGSFTAEGGSAVLSRDDAQKWIDSLPGRFCYMVARPGVIRRSI